MATLVDVPEELAPVARAVSAALERVSDRIEERLRSDLVAVERLCRHVERYRGKMVRPTLVVVSALAAGSAAQEGAGRGNANGHGEVEEAGEAGIRDEHVTVGAVCEMVHLATLVHDDVLDEAHVRRRGATVNSLQGNEAAVILGDLLFSAAYRLSAELKDGEASRLISAVGMTLCEGELLQLSRRGDFSLDEETYFEIVRRKTASLIGAACRLGARYSGAPAEVCDRFARFGECLGIAFQIQDDLLDLTGDQAVVGKDLHKDLEKGKLTLPLIHHLAAADARGRARTITLLEGARQDEALAAGLIERLTETDSIGHAQRAAAELVGQARTAVLGTDLVADTAARRFLVRLADAVVTREF